MKVRLDVKIQTIWSHLVLPLLDSLLTIHITYRTPSFSFEIPGRGTNIDRVKKSKVSAREYLADIKPEYLTFPWKTGDWSKAHGDGKASKFGASRMKSMKTTTAPPEYRIQILYINKPMLNFIMLGCPKKNGSTNPPTSHEVIDAIAIELGKVGK